jgi:hypothetical protein
MAEIDEHLAYYREFRAQTRLSALRCRLASFIVLAMLAIVSLVTPVSAQNSALTPELLSKLVDLTARKGFDREMPAIIATALGLSAAGQTWPNHQIITPDRENPHVFHAFAVDRGSEQDVLITLRNPNDGIHCFRTHRDGTLVKAVIYDLQAGQIVTPNHAEATKELNAEIAYWASAFADAK